MKRFAPLFLAVSLAALSACGQQPTQDETASVAPEAKPGLALTEGTLVLPAVKGNPAGGYFTLVNTGDKPVTLAAVTISGAARAEMHETKGGAMAPIANLEIMPGETVKFERGGKHIMAFDLDPQISADSKGEITLTFANGDKVSAPLKIEAPGGSMNGMAGMDHSGHSN
ncbi:MAG: copper chaperone PCu(A)C [Novosphingobium sp.]|jgi:copper(I)-binding protein